MQKASWGEVSPRASTKNLKPSLYIHICFTMPISMIIECIEECLEIYLKRNFALINDDKLFWR
jgi:hypothetical protein